MIKKGLIMLAVIFCLASIAIRASETNIALNKPYTYNVEPNYHLCTDEGDSVQLTDGKYATAWALWADKLSVGWSSKDYVEITIDLGKVEPISGVSYSSAAGSANVRVPRLVEVLVSDDGKTYYHLGNLIEMYDGDLPADEGGYREYRLKVNNLKTKGRYVRFIIFPKGDTSSMRYIFVDELEVYRGPEEYLKANPGKKVDNMDLFILRLLPWD